MNRAEFFAALFPDPTALIQFKTLIVDAAGMTPRRGYMYATSAEVPEIETWLAERADRELYFGVASRKNVEATIAQNAAGNGTGDSKLADCDRLWCLYGDIDFKAKERADVERRLNEMPVPPDIVVMSGNGFHVYWLLKEAVDARAAYTILKRLQAYIHSDDVADATRILRVPGTKNHKPGRGDVEIVRGDDTKRHDLAEFDFLPAVEGEVLQPVREHVPGDCPGADVVLAAFRSRGMLGPELEPGDKYSVTCPWASTHNSEDHVGKTVLFVNDEAGPGFNCFSAGCTKANGGTRRGIRDVESKFGITLDVRQAQDADLGEERYSDWQNSKLLAAEVHDKVAHAEEMRERFYIYDGTRLVLHSKNLVVPYIEPVVQRLFADIVVAKARIADLDEQIKIAVAAKNVGLVDQLGTARDTLEAKIRLKASGAARLESRDGIYAAIDLMKGAANVHVEMLELDAHPYWLNVRNGTLDLETGAFWEHRFSDLLTKVAGTVYDPQARCPRFEAFLADVLPDPAVRAFVQRSIGLALTDVTKDQCLWILYGTGRNGKSTLIHAVRAVLGDYAANTASTTLMVKKYGDDKRNDVAVLKGARFVSVSEAEDGHQLAESLVKDITGGDPLTARLMYAEFFTFVPTFKVFIAANHRPVIKGQDLGIWRRINLVPFTVTIPLDKVDADLPAALAAEAPGILNWAIAGFQDWRRDGLQPPAAVVAANEAYRRDSDELGEFLAEHFEEAPAGTVEAGVIWKLYQDWAQAGGVRYPLTRKRLGQQLASRGYEADMVGMKNTRIWRGLRLPQR
jgi:P4 family phage/plasmid primase-like protien